MEKTQENGYYSLFNLPRNTTDKERLAALGILMKAPKGDFLPTSIPSGYVYFGQFLVHDITRLERGKDKPHGDPIPIKEGRQQSNPTLELDSLYGNSKTKTQVACKEGKMLLGAAYDDDGKAHPDLDLPRDPKSLSARIGDDRNDENLLTAQLHVQFLKLHNFFFDRFKDQSPNKDNNALYQLAKQQVILHYQHVIVEDFLYLLLDLDVWEYLFLNNGESLYDPAASGSLDIPVEFSGAAMRFGHKMVRDEYLIRNQESISLSEIFTLTGKQKFGGHKGLPLNRVIDWRFFFDFAHYGKIDTSSVTVNHAVGINEDVTLTPKPAETEHCRDPAHQMAQEDDALAIRNLKRGRELQLPSGQQLAAHLLDKPQYQPLLAGIKLTQDYIDQINNALIHSDTGFLSKLLRCLGLHQKTPLWYYLLAESRIHYNGSRLGKLSSLIIAEVIKGLIKASNISIYTSSIKLEPCLPPTGQHEGDSKRYHQMSDLLYPLLNTQLQTPDPLTIQRPQASSSHLQGVEDVIA